MFLEAVLDPSDPLNSRFSNSFNFDENFSDAKIVRKIMRSLLEPFRPMVMTIEEIKDLDSMRVEELVDSLQTYISSHCVNLRKPSLLHLRLSRKEPITPPMRNH